MKKKLISAMFALLPSFAFAHPGHGAGFSVAFAHPFTGLDHLLMMLCVGVLAGHIGGRMRWQLPCAFLSAMTVGWAMAVNGFFIDGIESGIAAGLIALGVLFAWRMAMPRMAQVGIVAMFALLHGMAHGRELVNTAPLVASAGFLVATALLHCAGLGVAALLPRQRENAYRAIGVLLTLAGGGFLATM